MWSSVALEDYADQPTPKTVADYESLAQKWWLELDQLRNADGWVETDVGVEGVVFLQKEVPGYDIPMLQIRGVLPGTPEEVCRFPDVCTTEERAIFDPQIKSHDYIEDISEKIGIVAVVYRGFYPAVAERDFVAFRAYKELQNGTWISLGHTINHRSRPISSSPVRAKGKLGMYCEPISGKPYHTLCTKLVLVDPMGSIPSWLIKLAQTQAVKGHVKMAQVLEARYGESNRPQIIELPSPPLPTIEELPDLSDYQFYDAVEYGSDDDFHTFDDTVCVTAVSPPTQIPYQTDQSNKAISEPPTNLSIIKQLQETANQLSDRLKKIEKAVQESRKGIFLSWTQLFALLGWPIVVILVYHFLSRGKDKGSLLPSK